MEKIAVVTGAGSGVGQAVAIRLARAGWRVAIVGRRQATLDETVIRAADAGQRMLICPADLAGPGAIRTAVTRVLERWPTVHALVNSAGTNVRQRAMAELSEDDWRQVMDVNVTAAFLMAQAFLPAMRRQREGTIVNIVSDAGLQANVKAGPAYVASKFAMRGLTQSINLEEKAHGIRASAIFPGDINTPLLDKRPSPPPMDLRADMLQPEDLAEVVWMILNLPPRAVVEEVVIRPR